jgi:putative hydroxymethylpyrimidine transport system substrate-binding protein
MNRRDAMKLAAGMAALLATPASSQPARAERLTLLLDWFVNPGHAPIVIAVERGFFRDAGLDVQVVPPADPSAPPRLIAARQADIAISYQPNLHLQVGEGLPLVRIGTLVATPLNILCALDGGPIRTLADMRGRTVGFSVGGFEDALLGAMLRTVGLSLRDVRLVNVNFALTQALIGGRVDAVIGAFRNFELTQIALEGRRGLAFYPEEHGVPLYDELIFVAHRERIGDPRLRRFVDALERAVAFIVNRPAEAWEIFKRAYPRLDDELNRRAWADSLPRFSKTPAALDVARYGRFARFLADAGLLRDVPAVETYALELRST